MMLCLCNCQLLLVSVTFVAIDLQCCVACVAVATTFPSRVKLCRCCCGGLSLGTYTYHYHISLPDHNGRCSYPDQTSCHRWQCAQATGHNEPGWEETAVGCLWHCWVSPRLHYYRNLWFVIVGERLARVHGMRTLSAGLNQACCVASHDSEHHFELHVGQLAWLHVECGVCFPCLWWVMWQGGRSDQTA